jgi:antirestriction protein ArdC
LGVALQFQGERATRRKKAAQGEADSALPLRGSGRTVYRGVNVWLLMAQGYTSPYWATIRQINELSGHIRKGEKATPVVFWRIYVDGVEAKAGDPEPETQEAEGQGRRRFVLRYYSVFNTDQCELPARGGSRSLMHLMFLYNF